MTPKPQASPAPNVYDQLLRSRIIWLREEVRDDNSVEIASKLMLLSAEDPDADIYLYIASPGGSVTAGTIILDAMNLIPNDVVTVGTGMAASMGQFLLTAGTQGKRFATPLLRVLLHQPSGGFGGSQSDIETQAALIEDMKHVLATITAKNTGQTVERVVEDGDRDKWFNAEQALEYGFVDHILKDGFDEIRTICAAVDAKKGAK